MARLVGQWWRDPNFSHGFFVPLFSAFVLWQERDRLARITPRPSWSGLVVIALALVMLMVGRLGAELFLARSSLLLLLAGGVILFAGWRFLRAIFFPWAFLALMIPIPALILGHLTFPLQLFTSRMSAGALELLGVPVGLQGNVLNLAAMQLSVAEACSGIRSLISLLTLAIIYGYLLETRLALRWVLAFAALPIAILANSIRVVGTGLLVQYWDKDKAEGYYHSYWGVLIFVISLLLLYALHALLRWLWPALFPGDGESASRGVTAAANRAPARTGSPLRFVLAAVLLASAAVVLYARAHDEATPPRRHLESFPQQLGAWTGTDQVIPEDELAVLGEGEFLKRDYESQESAQPGVNLFIAYYPSQTTNDTPHSPQHCLPGSGLTPIENQRITLTIPGFASFPANRYLVARGDYREVVLYWFWAHGRGIASEYWFKYYLVKDSLQMHRSDGAMVRFITPLYPGETAEAAMQRLLPFASQVMPVLDNYIPR